MGAAMLRSHDLQYYYARFNSVTLLLLDAFAKEEISRSWLLAFLLMKNVDLWNCLHTTRCQYMSKATI